MLTFCLRKASNMYKTSNKVHFYDWSKVVLCIAQLFGTFGSEVDRVLTNTDVTLGPRNDPPWRAGRVGESFWMFLAKPAAVAGRVGLETKTWSFPTHFCAVFAQWTGRGVTVNAAWNSRALSVATVKRRGTFGVQNGGGVVTTPLSVEEVCSPTFTAGKVNRTR